jgi:hypothetical protein
MLCEPSEINSIEIVKVVFKIKHADREVDPISLLWLCTLFENLTEMGI